METYCSSGVTGPGGFLLALQLSDIPGDTAHKGTLSLGHTDSSIIYVIITSLSEQYLNIIEKTGLDLAITDLGCYFFSSVSVLSQSTSPSIT